MEVVKLPPTFMGIPLVTAAPIIVHFPACHYPNGICNCPSIAASHAAQQKARPLAHYASCPLRGPIGNPAQDLAAGCTCVPFP